MTEYRLHNRLPSPIDRSSLWGSDLLAHAHYLFGILVDPFHPPRLGDPITPVGPAILLALGRVEVFLAIRRDQDVSLLLVDPSGQIVVLLSGRSDVGVQVLLVGIVQTLFAPI